MKNSVFVDVRLFEWILVVFPVFQNMGVVTGVLERAITFPFVKVPAWDFVQGFRVFFNQLILFVSAFYHHGRWDNQVRLGPANRTCSEVSFLHFFVVGCSPVSNAIQTEWMRAIVKDAKSLSFRKNWFQANYTLFVPFN